MYILVYNIRYRFFVLAPCREALLVLGSLWLRLSGCVFDEFRVAINSSELKSASAYPIIILFLLQVCLTPQNLVSGKYRISHTAAWKCTCPVLGIYLHSWLTAKVMSGLHVELIHMPDPAMMR